MAKTFEQTKGKAPAATSRKRPHSDTAQETAKPKGTVFRKTAKKAKQDNAAQLSSTLAAVASKPKPAAVQTPKSILKKAVPSPGKPADKGKGKAPAFQKPAPKAVLSSKGPTAVATQKPKPKPKAKASKPKVPRSAPPIAPLPVLPPPTTSFRVVVGSYERLLYGLQGTLTLAPGGSVAITFKPIFTFPAHVSSIRAVACAGAAPIPAAAIAKGAPLSKWLATGGTDETIKVWDLRKRIEVGALTGHDGTITSLSFPTPSYLLTTSVDSHLNLYRVRDWALLRTLRGHVGRVNCAAAHPSGRLALSVGADRTIRMWDLMRGKGAASVKIYEEKEVVRWDTSGRRFAVLGPRGAEVYSTDMKLLHRVVDADSAKRVRLHDVVFHPVPSQDAEGSSGTPHELMLVSTEDGVVKVYDLDADVAAVAEPAKLQGSSDDEDEDEGLTPLTLIARLVGHKNRVRAVTVQSLHAPSAPPTLIATTISSDGLVRSFDLRAVLERMADSNSNSAPASPPLELQGIGHFDTQGARLTCLAVVGVQDEGGDEGAELDDEQDDLIRSDDDESADDDDDDDEDEVAEERMGDDLDDGGSSSDASIDLEAEESELAALQAQILAAKKQGLWLEGMEEGSDDGGAAEYLDRLIRDGSEGSEEEGEVEAEEEEQEGEDEEV